MTESSERENEHWGLKNEKVCLFSTHGRYAYTIKQGKKEKRKDSWLLARAGLSSYLCRLCTMCVNLSMLGVVSTTPHYESKQTQAIRLGQPHLRDHILGATGFLPGSGPIISFHLSSIILFSCIGFADHILRNSSSSFLHLCISESSQSSAVSAV
jgi:hypothetical protein